MKIRTVFFVMLIKMKLRKSPINMSESRSGLLLFFGNGIKPALTKRIASQNSPHGECGSDNKPALFERFDGIFGAGRDEPAGRCRLQRRDIASVQPDEPYKDTLHGCVFSFCTDP